MWRQNTRMFVYRQIRADATPYDPRFDEYFQKRAESKRERFGITRQVAGLC